jgi:hypothetical protein
MRIEKVPVVGKDSIVAGGIPAQHGLLPAISLLFFPGIREKVIVGGQVENGTIFYRGKQPCDQPTAEYLDSPNSRDKRPRNHRIPSSLFSCQYTAAELRSFNFTTLQLKHVVDEYMLQISITVNRNISGHFIQVIVIIDDLTTVFTVFGVRVF